MVNRRRVLLRGLLTLVLGLVFMAPPSWAAIAFVQGKNAEEVDTLSDDVAFTWNGNTTTGNAIVCGLTTIVAGGTPVIGVTDSQSNTYTLGPITDGPFATRNLIAHAANITGGTTPTVTATFTDGSTQRSMSCGEFSGLATSTPLDQQTGQAQTDPGTGTDAVSSGTMTTTQHDELIVGATCCFSPPATAGTGFTKFPGSDVSTVTEYRIVSITGTYAATFTTGTATDDFATRGATFKMQHPPCRGSLMLMGIGGC